LRAVRARERAVDGPHPDPPGERAGGAQAGGHRGVKKNRIHHRGTESTEQTTRQRGGTIPRYDAPIPRDDALRPCVAPCRCRRGGRGASKASVPTRSVGTRASLHLSFSVFSVSLW